MLSPPASPLKTARSSRAESISAKRDRPDRSRTAKTSRQGFPPKRLPRAHKLHSPNPGLKKKGALVKRTPFSFFFFARENSSKSAKFLPPVQHFLNRPIFRYGIQPSGKEISEWRFRMSFPQ